MSDSITEYLPHVTSEVKQNGTVTVGRKYAGYVVDIYIRRKDQADEAEE